MSCMRRILLHEIFATTNVRVFFNLGSFLSGKNKVGYHSNWKSVLHDSNSAKINYFPTLGKSPTFLNNSQPGEITENRMKA